MTWIPGDTSNSETLTPSDHLYYSHINELREAIDNNIGLAVTVSRTSSGSFKTDGTNDEVQINYATNFIQTMSATGYGTLFLPDAEYHVGSSPIILRNYIHIRGNGRGSTTIYGGSSLGTNAVMLGTASIGSPLTDCVISDLKIDGSNMPTSPVSTFRKGIDVLFTLRMRVFNVWIYKTPATGFGPDCNKLLIVDNCIFDQCGTAGQNPGYNGLGIGTGYYAEESCVVSNCVAIGGQNNGFLLEYVGGGLNSRHYQFVNCYAYGNKRGFRVSGASGATFMGCKAIDSTNEGFYIQLFGAANATPENTKIIGCDAYNNGSDGIYFKDQEYNQINIICEGNHVYSNAGDGIICGGRYAQIKNNICWNNDNDGIFYHANSANTIGDSNISGNICYNNGQAGISGRSDGIRVHGELGTIANVVVKSNQCFDTQGTPTQQFGIAVKDYVKNIKVGDNICHDNSKTGIFYQITTAVTATNARITDNICFNNGKGGVATATDGIRVWGSGSGSLADVQIRGNRCFDDQSVKTQDYGIAIKDNITDIQILDNDVRGNKTAGMLHDPTTPASPTIRYRNNKGWNPEELYAQGAITGSTTFDRINGDVITATLNANITVTLTNGKSIGDRLGLILTQDGTGNRTVTWPANFKKAGGTLTLSTAAAAADQIDMRWDGSNWIEVARSLNVS